MPSSEKIHRIVKQGKHLVATLNALGMVFDFGASQIGSCQIDRLQEVINSTAKLNLKLFLHLLDGQLHAPYHIPVLFQQPPGVMVAGILRQSFFSCVYLPFRVLLLASS